ncbi:T9SS type B sorting domain-containing protein [Chitinophaga sancti]|uniref:Gliding motility-associated C-terminal domain-containing protein n=1 Tax=Chitinophaga sancti TaxID=1004 RepID=A0A1K1M4T7_9BACT|nr:gliding motility-associated C-terminal domain-containing protein [Chitinophaga sancti]WQD64628.1 gliding motility-associated C-terminal domain-containing protein [Chitinophaga sancti]WQG89749.1 gliding motility-associated C-terminal domain-containing protein [Chitinophaga sancti]SFW18157.1 gliding motility-associated C-terminal domain-containing protein [Chitinophaga sancti]
MLLKKFFLYLVMVLALLKTATAQTCTSIGQTPSTAFPVCGTKSFIQKSVPICETHDIPGPNCNIPGDGTHTDINPYWYKFTCYTTGTLGFTITPNTLSDDYDWQLFDITNKQPDAVFTNKSLYVCMNWSGEGGITGASAAGTSLDVCGGPGQPLFSKMPTITKGHEYILLISHFDGDSQSGYSLAFDGGTADITDPAVPELLSATYRCLNNTIKVAISRKVACSTLAADGSDFTLVTPGGFQITGASSTQCGVGFDFDTLSLSLSAIPPAGDYIIAAQAGTDGNTLANTCGNPVPVGDTLHFRIGPPPVITLVSQGVTGCAPNELKIVLSSAIRCSSISANGSDFSITGPEPISITGAHGLCDSDNLTDTVVVQLSHPIYSKGNYTVTLKSGTDGNVLVGECGQPVQQYAQAVVFHTADTVNANFSYTADISCKINTVEFIHDGNHDVNSWQWTFDDGTKATTQEVVKVYSTYGIKTAALMVSNGVCSDSAFDSINFEQTLNAEFFVDPGPYCPLDVVIPRDSSYGNIIRYFWDYGNGVTSIGPSGEAQQYFPTSKEQRYLIRLIVEDELHCKDTADHYITAVTSCYIDVPTAFSPNNDGVNDYLYPLNAYKAVDLYFAVYNRIGQLVFETTDWTRRWDGNVKGEPADIGTYVWMLRYTMKDSGKKIFRKGTTTLIR